MVSLEGVVPDVLFLILLRASGMRELWGLIRASPRIYAIFRERRDAVLSAVITREIGIDIMDEARIALSTSRFDSRGLSKAQAIEWVAKYNSTQLNNSSLPEAPHGLEAMSLWRRHRDVKFIASLFLQEKLPILESMGLLGDKTLTIDRLSDVERMRIYRSIYQYAIYGDVFYFDPERKGASKGVIIGGYEQSHIFLTSILAWQVEELSTMNDFITDQIMKKWQEAEDDLYKSLQDDPTTWDVERKHDSRWETSFFSATNKASFSHWQHYFATLTIAELRDVFAGTGASLVKVIKKYAHRWGHAFLNEALEEEPLHATFYTSEYEAQEEARVGGVQVNFKRDAVELPNEAWLWAHKYQPCELYTTSSHDFAPGNGLRRFGYVFWDSHRLQRSQILQKGPQNTADYALANFPRPEYQTESVEERIRKLAQSFNPPEPWSSHLSNKLPFSPET
ncbi:hypothetical protein G7Y89_g581 [Cudoniella acicularis]|uniref:Uncharacterized protein n=1 Tax=Cudoniella acicularis TaxID=354080 RepID=A0A8H4RXW6_9HELO|nr:hypothetical protein G7Y89_g581 [Cudoniella acicularis]